MKKGYGQVCPIAKAAEVICDRWTPLLLRELMCGSRYFNELAAGLPLMSRSLLAQRLRELEDAGVLVGTPKQNGPGHEYVLTPAGEAIRPIIESLGMWSQRWGSGRIRPDDFEESSLAWALSRILRKTVLGKRAIVLRLDLHGLKKSRSARRSWWLVVGATDVDICFQDPGYEVDATITANASAFVHVLLGHHSLASALRSRDIRFDGPREIVRELPGWLYLDGRYMQTVGIYPPAL
jgi:DNA-binding HxlR family transcriptional regulator